jgi:hypothetical protein
MSSSKAKLTTNWPRQGKAVPGRINYANTTKGYIKKAKGGPRSRSKGGNDDNAKRNNPKNNPKNNKKNALKPKLANDRNNREIIEAQGLTYALRSKEEAIELCDKLFSSENPPLLDNMAMSEAIASNRFAIYIETTKRALKDEALRWLTERGAQDQRGTRSGLVVYTDRRNRPVLVHEDGT